MTTTAIQKSTANQPPARPSALNLMASRINVEPAKLLATLKSTVFKGATDEELLALVAVANEYHLNPFLKEIYAFPAKGGGICPIVSVDGWNKMLLRQPEFDGIEFDFTETQEGELISCTATIYVKGRSHAVKVTEYFNECKRNTQPWNDMPRRMLRNRTLCQASRLAFGFSGVYNDDEGATVIDVAATTMPTEPPPKVIAAPSDMKTTVHQEIESLVVGEGLTFQQFRDYVASAGLIEDADSLTSFADMKTADATRLMRAKVGLITNIKKLVEPKA